MVGSKYSGDIWPLCKKEKKRKERKRKKTIT